jgi:hypothetical protein
MNFDHAEHQRAAGADYAEAHRKAYNAAFSMLGLRWQWDADTYRELLRIPEEMERIGTYLATQQANLLTAYGKEFLSGLIYAAKQRCQDAVIESDTAPDRFDDVH